MDVELRILILEDSEDDADLLIRFLKKENIKFNHQRVYTEIEFISKISNYSFDLIISDHSMPQFSGMDAFRIMRSQKLNIPYIIVTGTVSEKILLEYSREGIDDYIFKENLLRLPNAIEHILSKKKVEILLKKLKIVHNDIKDSINYAKQIQNSILPDTVFFHNYFADCFLIFKPKDTLSGDFFWFKQIENSFFIAAADCTGHGIPGALLSMIGIEKLNNMSLLEHNPAEILTQLNSSIQTALCQSTQYDHSPDGMDIAFCSFNNQKKQFQFCGANRPLWIIRKDSDDVEVIKGTKKAIGGETNNYTSFFQNHTVDVNTGDIIYFFSDGFCDQFGGEFDKKITSKRFKKELVRIKNENMINQKILLVDFFESWRGKEEQVDDVLIIGIRI